MKYFLTVLALCIGATIATPFQDCGSSGTPVFLDVEGCTTLPCVVERGKSYPANITFTAHHDAASLTVAVTANIAGIETPWPGFDPVGCDYLVQGSCPITTGTEVIWSYLMVILPEYPTIQTTATFRIFDEADPDHDDVCLKAPVQIV